MLTNEEIIKICTDYLKDLEGRGNIKEVFCDVDWHIGLNEDGDYTAEGLIEFVLDNNNEDGESPILETYFFTISTDGKIIHRESWQ